MSLTAIKPPEVIRWSKDFYYQMGELGWFDGKKVELIDGEIFEMSPIGSHHAVSVVLVADALRAILPVGYFVNSQNPLNSGNRSEPLPDAAVVPGKIRDYSNAHPQTAVLVVEVADSSLRHDQRMKSRLYASQGIQEYWIVDLNGESLIVHRGPFGALDDPASSNYSHTLTLDNTSTISPLFAPEATIDVSSLLP